MWPDNETDVDFVNFTGVADTVAEVIEQAAGRPVSIGISGAWGVGKSSMIKLIRHSIEKRDKAEPPQYVFVEFDAWLYQGYDDARAALLEVIATTLADEAQRRKTGMQKVGEFLKRVEWFRAVKLGAGSAVALALGLPPAGLIGEIYSLGKRAAAGTIDEQTIAEGETVARKAESAAGGLLKAKPVTSPPKEIHALRDTFRASLKELNVRLIVLIDDLDRCLPETTISTLEAIRLFLFLENTAFVIAADDMMIKHAVKRHFEGIDDPKLVTNYFDKLIQLPIRVPPLGTQEVRGYMMLLFVETSTLPEPQKEALRVGVCKQLSQTWRGARVDRAFMQSLQPSLPPELLARFDVAERLAPIMTSAAEIAGNPRLVKRFLNALSVRMTIASAHGVGVDEAVLAKMLLFERCGNPLAHAELMKAVNEDAEGKPRFLAEGEAARKSGEKVELQSPWNDEFVQEWLSLSPQLADLDLRGALYVSREHAPIISPEDRLTSEGAALLAALMTHPEVASSSKAQLAKLSRTDTTVIITKVLDRARQEQAWGVPAILEACLTLVDVDPTLGSQVASFLSGRPVSQIKPDIVPRIGDYPWAAGVFSTWEKAGVGLAVQRAIKQGPGHGNITV